MKRREFTALLFGAVAQPSLVIAQIHHTPQIGVLSVFAENDPEGRRRMAAFVQRLQELGWQDGRNVKIEFRWAGGDPERTRAYVAELVGLSPNVIFVNHALAMPLLRQETHSIPIVFVQISDPVAAGFVESLARPGGNMTGFSNAEFSWGEKMLEVLKEIAPNVSHVRVILSSEQVAQLGLSHSMEAVASSLKTEVTVTGVHDAMEIENAIDAAGRSANGGLIVLASGVTNAHRKTIIALAARHRLPALYPFRYFVMDGGLISYGTDPAEQYRQGAGYVDRILRGERAADLPVQQPIKFELVINRKTARALGLDVPPQLLATADEVIE